MNIFIDPISFVIPSYNNLRYLKNAYRSIRSYAGTHHEIIVLDDASTDGTLKWLSTLQDTNLVIWNNTTGKRLGHTITYNIGGEMATNEIFTILHADMFIGPNYVENALKHLKPGVVVAGTRIEPPLHPEGKEKIVKDFGLWPETFMETEFLNFIREEQTRQSNKTTRGIFAPWFIYKKDFLAIGGHDKLFAPFPYEDSDIFQRFILAGYELVQSRDALVYHLTCRGHKWTDENVIGKVDDSFHLAEFNARKNYIRKWNSWIKNDEYHAPIIPKKYDTCAVISNLTNISVLDALEPWFGTVIINATDENIKQEINQYIIQQQSHTIMDMSTRVKVQADDLTSHDVYVILDVNTFSREDFSIITELSSILGELEGSVDCTGEYELGSMKIKVNRLKNVVNTLINC